MRQAETDPGSRRRGGTVTLGSMGAASITPPTDRARGPLLALAQILVRGLARLPRPLAGAAAAGWMLLIWWLSSGPIGIEPVVPLQDFVWNLAHAPTFGLLAVLLARAVAGPRLAAGWPRGALPPLLLAWLLVAAWAGLDEWHQARVPARTGSGWDFLTDVTGAAAALGLVHYAARADASGRGFARRLALALAACAVAAAAATWSGPGRV